jgi:DGQHR domain-containing protein
MSVRRHVIKNVDEKEKDYLRQKGWMVRDYLGDDLFQVHKTLNKWELFQARLRELFVDAGFENTIGIDDFHYTELGYHFDAIGGIDSNLILVDCVAKEDESGYRIVHRKIKQLSDSMDEVRGEVEKVLGNRYQNLYFCLVTRDLDNRDSDVKDARSKGVYLRDSDFFEHCMGVSSTLGATLQPQIVRFLTGEMLPFPKEDRLKPLRMLALRKESADRVTFHFSLTPEALLKLAYVHRIHRGEKEGYQRPLKLSKLRGINRFLFEQKLGFPNDIIISFDEREGCALKWEVVIPASDEDGAVESGWLTIPQYYSVAEVIDGQHRLFGYMDFSPNRTFDFRLSERRKRDLLGVVALSDPSGQERAQTYIDINSKQTRISKREIWVLMGRSSPNVLMGYVSNLVQNLNSKGVFKDAIQVPGVTVGRGRSVNIANFGQSILDLRLVHIEGPEWNLVENRDRLKEYPAEPQDIAVDTLDRYFRSVRRCDRWDWDARSGGFLCTNNGIYVMLRVLSELLRENNGRITDKILKKTFEPTPGCNLVREFIEKNEGARSLAKRTSNAASRADVAIELMLDINKHNSKFARRYLEERGKLTENPPTEVDKAPLP